MRQVFRNLSIKAKIISIVLVISCLTASVGGFVDYQFEMNSYQYNNIQNTINDTKLIGQYCYLPLEFDYPEKAKEVLTKLIAKPYIQKAIIYNVKDSLYASFSCLENDHSSVPLDKVKINGFYVDGNFIHVYQPIIYNEKYYGHIYIRTFSNQSTIAKNRLFVAFILILFMLLFAYVLAFFLQKIVSLPIVQLTNFTKQIAISKNYAQQLKPTSTDETGQLYQSFNTMLDTIRDKECERDQALVKLEKSNEQYEHLSSLTNEGILIHENGIVVDLNESLCRLLDYKKDEVIDQNIFNKIFDLSTQTIIYTNIENNVTNAFQVETIKKDGSTFPVEIELRYTLLHNKSYGVAAIRDIRESRKMSTKLSESEHLLSRIVETNPNIIYIYDLIENKNIYVNHEIVEDLGYTPSIIQEIGSNLIVNLIHPDDLPMVVNHHIKFENANENDIYELEYRMKHMNGEWRWIRSRDVLFLRNENGKAQQILGSAIDITNHKKAQIEIKNEKDRAEQYLQVIEVVLVVIDVDAKVMLLNRKGQQVLGYDNNELIGQDWFHVCLPANEFEQVKQIFHEIMRGKIEPFEYFENHIITKNGEKRLIAWHNTYVKDQNGKITSTLSSGEDITERKYTENELNKYRGHLEELVNSRTDDLNKSNELLLVAKEIAESANRAKSEFLSNMSHELRTPLNAILGFSKILRTQKNILYSQKEQLLTIHNCGEHLLSLINDILDMSKIEAQKFDLQISETNLMQVVQTAFNINKIKADEKDLDYVLVKKNTIPTYVMADERKLKQIMLNLINNAIKFTYAGKVTINVDFIEEGSLFVFEVQDTGIGIPKDKQAVIFQPFVQYVGERIFQEGTGLGLSITQKLVDLMGGQLGIQSNEGEGSCFSIKIPLASFYNSTDVERPELEIKTAYLGQRKKILIVDDNQTNTSLLVSILEPLDFTLETAENGAIAFSKLNWFLPDLILLDFKMPVMNGIEFGQKIRTSPQFEMLKIMGISATVPHKEQFDIFVGLCQAFIPKPINIDLFFEKLTALLEIEWLEQKSEICINQKLTEYLVYPEKESIDKLLNYCELGDYNSTMSQLNELDSTKYSLFLKSMYKMVRKYDFEEINKFLNQYN